MVNVPATFFEEHDDFEEHGGPGAIQYCDGAAIIKCPGCGRMSACDERQGDNHPSWAMNKETHTWQPSVHHTAENGGCGWHGHLVNGEWIPC